VDGDAQENAERIVGAPAERAIRSAFSAVVA
jgi:hypothetical protein